MTLRGIIFDLGWTLVDFGGDMVTPDATIQQLAELPGLMREAERCRTFTNTC